MKEKILIVGSLFMCLSVILGAFGAHSFEEVLTFNSRIETYNTAVKYMMYHSLGILFIGTIHNKKYHLKYQNWSFYSIIIGIFLFSGSLIILSFTNITKFGIITPFGGMFFILGWILLILSLVSVKKNIQQK
jgi:uncharacterized membrane protein YgdD (TMEM256/DUF423 family)